MQPDTPSQPMNPRFQLEDCRRTLIVGLGDTGLSCARYLHARGIACSVVDSRELPPGLEQFRDELADVPLTLGGFDKAAFEAADCLIVSPGVSLQVPVIAAARAAGKVVLGDIEMFAGVCQAPVAAVTGSNGKSTVTRMLGDMAIAAGLKVRVGGNLGPPALDLITDDEPDLYVLELSSFQLETTRSLDAATAVVLNVSPDHMDRYHDYQDYLTAKARVYRGTGVPVINRDDPSAAALVEADRTAVAFTLSEPGVDELGVRQVGGEEWFACGEENLMPLAELCLDGRHNVANALAALALGWNLGLDWEPMLETLRNFGGLPHRCQRVRQLDGVGWYNDSKATNVGATLAAVRGMAAAGPVVLIAGGDAKAADFSALREVMDERVRAVVLMGRDAGVIESAIDGLATCVHASDLEQAVSLARSSAHPGDIVLLSPACASFDMYTGYEQRGEHFITLVESLS